VRAVFDTNILIDYLRGVEAAREELARFDEPAISLVTWMEVQVGAEDAGEEVRLRGFLARFDLRPISIPVAERAVRLRRRHGLRLPDAVIWATAEELSGLLVTRNVRDFPEDDPGVRIPYEV